MIQRERFHFAIQFGRQKGGGDEENYEKGAHSSLLSLLLGILFHRGLTRMQRIFAD
jgi:hypothetical protein